MPDKTAIQKRGNLLVPQSPMRLVLEADEGCISKLQAGSDRTFALIRSIRCPLAKQAVRPDSRPALVYAGGKSTKLHLFSKETRTPVKVTLATGIERVHRYSPELVRPLVESGKRNATWSTTAEMYTHAEPASRRAAVEELERTIWTTKLDPLGPSQME